MPGILYVVATPIGNLEDVTLRALRILREVSLVAAEDTRRTSRLLQHYSISTRTTSLHAHNEREKTPRLIERLQAGESIALVSDAGTPVISDPGESLVAAVRAAGIRVESIPGPSAVMAAVAASGLEAGTFSFLGFPPSRSKDLAQWLADVRLETRLVVFFEAPHRLRATLTALGAVYGLEHVVGVGRELTKAHEELVVRPITALVDYFTHPIGEFTLLVPPAKIGRTTEIVPPSREQLLVEMDEILAAGAASRRGAARRLAARYGLAANEVYDLLSKPGK